ncbi:unnamed protein product [Oppiella nova]|uniref:Phosphatidylinositol-specific phospholipase C X domain-containing protein n=1 Tax=Oppiella nova TaxID=334625 RepID=A0A7R9M4I5_9ACAR|nr:unnamed protein product [Oppiella nova]CAG2170517.1 unnamed protein product [Oppiella nova]
MDTKDFWQLVPDVQTERRLVMNWMNAPKGCTDDWVALTSHQILNIDFNANETLINGCLKWHIIYVRNNTILAQNCFKTQPFWMENSLHSIGHKRLDEIAIPGAHDSGCYHKYGLNNIPTKSIYLYAQDESIFDQLVYGIRYVDIRVGHQEDDYQSLTIEEPLQIIHGQWMCEHSVRRILQDIKAFLMAAPKEVVIFDIHKHRNFMNDSTGQVFHDRHQQLMDLIKEFVGQWIAPETNKTINEMIESDKRLVIGYEDKHVLTSDTDRGLVWHPVRHQWANENSVEGLEQYFRSHLCSPHERQYLRSAMAQMTPTFKEIIFSFQSKGGLRQRADTVNPLFPKWFYSQWWDCINIVSADYFLGSNIVDIAIKVNEKKFASNLIR